MEIENLIRYTEPAVGLKPSANQAPYPGIHVADGVGTSRGAEALG